MSNTVDTNGEGIRYRESLLAETREELQKADSKASVLLAASGIAISALLAAAVAGTWSPNKLHHGDARVAAWAAMCLAVLGTIVIGGAVKPRLRARSMDREKLHYFGNVRSFWPSPWRLRNRKERLSEGRDAFEAALRRAANSHNYVARLDDQIWFLGRTAFRKYRYITIGMWTFGGGIAVALIGLILEKW